MISDPEQQAMRARANARRSDRTGRSAERRPLGYGKGWKPETPFVQLPLRLLDSSPYRALGIHARRVLDFLIREHLHHHGSENGLLAAPHRQLTENGVPKRDCLKGIEQLIAFGLVDRTQVGGRLGGRDQPALYRLTFLPDHLGNRPTDNWKKVTPATIDAWMAEQTTAAAFKRLRRAEAKPAKI